MLPARTLPPQDSPRRHSLFCGSHQTTVYYQGIVEWGPPGGLTTASPLRASPRLG